MRINLIESVGSVLMSTEDLCYVSADRRVDSELVCWGCLVVQGFDDGDGASGPIYGEEGRRGLEGEENAASSALVWICGIHHEHWSAHRCILKDTFKHTHTSVGTECRQTAWQTWSKYMPWFTL